MRHLYSNECHDESEVWCERHDYFRESGYVEPTRDPAQADCPVCLDAAAIFGSAAAARLRELIPPAVHVYPNGGREHALSADCWCRPEPDRAEARILVHKHGAS